MIGGGNDQSYPNASALLGHCVQSGKTATVINIDAHLDVRPLRDGALPIFDKHPIPGRGCSFGSDFFFFWIFSASILDLNLLWGVVLVLIYFAFFRCLMSYVVQ